jgi:hypothetical protein
MGSHSPRWRRGALVTWLRGTLAGRVVYLRAEPLPRGRRLFVERRSDTWRAFSARDYLD